MTKPAWVVEQGHPLSWMKVFILRGVNSLLAATDWTANVRRLHVKSSSKGCFKHLNGLFLNSSIRKMFEEKDYRAVNMVLSTISAYIGRAIGFQNGVNMTGFYHIYFEMVSKEVLVNYVRRWSVAEFKN